MMKLNGKVNALCCVLIYLIFFLTAAVTLSGCSGGGGGDGGSGGGGGEEARTITIYGSVIMDTGVSNSKVSVLSAETSQILATANTDSNGYWEAEITASALAADDNLVLSAESPVNNLVIRSFVSADDIRSEGDRYTSNLCAISNYTEALLIFAEADGQDISAAYLDDMISVGGNGHPQPTGYPNVDRFAASIRSAYYDRSPISLAQSRANLLGEYIFIRWPAIFKASESTTLSLPRTGPLAGYSLSIVERTGLQGATVSSNDVVVDAGGPATGDVTLSLAGKGVSAVTVSLPVLVTESREVFSRTIPQGEFTITAPDLSLDIPYDAFEDGAHVTIHEMTQLPSGLPVGVLKGYDVNLGREPNEPVTITYNLADGQSADDVILIHIDPAGKEARYVYPDTSAPVEGVASFSLSSLSPTFLAIRPNGNYNLGMTFYVEELMVNTKESFEFIKNFIIDYIDDDDRIKRMSMVPAPKGDAQAGLSENDEIIEYFTKFTSRALASFMEIGADEENLNQLAGISFRYGALSSSVDARIEYENLREKVIVVALKIANVMPVNGIEKMALIEEFRNELGSGNYEPYLDSRLLIDDGHGFGFWLPSAAYEMIHLSQGDIETRFRNIENTILAAQMTDSERCSVFQEMSRYAEAEKLLLLARSPKLPADEQYVSGELAALSKECLGSANREHIELYNRLVDAGHEVVLGSNGLKVIALLNQQSQNVINKYFKAFNDTNRINVTRLQIQNAPKNALNGGYYGSNGGRWFQEQYSGVDVLIPNQTYQDLRAVKRWVDAFSDRANRCDIPDNAFVSAPMISPSAGEYTSALVVDLSRPGATIRYTTNGSIPSRTNGTIYTEPFSVTTNTVVQAVAYDDTAISQVASANYTMRAPSYTVSANAGTGGSVTSSSTQTVSNRQTAAFTVIAASGYNRSNTVSTNCAGGSGSWSGNTYTTKQITSDCSVFFSFVQAGGGSDRTLTNHGTINDISGRKDEKFYYQFFVPANSSKLEISIWHTPGADSPRNADLYLRHGTRPTTKNSDFKVVSNDRSKHIIVQNPQSGYWYVMIHAFADFSGANLYSAYTAGVAQHTVTATAGTGGSVSPTSRTVNHGSATIFTVTPNSGYTRGNATGSCPAGSWSGNTYTTGTITSGCSVNFDFVASSTTHTLQVSKSGSGQGTVTSNPAGISCGSTCGASFAGGQSVSLSADAASGSTFAGWGGECSGSGTCQVTMNQARSVTATFNVDGSSSTPITEENLAGSWRITITDSAYDTSTYYIDVTLSSNGTFAYTEVDPSVNYYYSGNGNWSYNEINRYFDAYANNQGLCTGTLSANASNNAFSVAGNFYNSAATYNWVRTDSNSQIRFQENFNTDPEYALHFSEGMSSVCNLGWDNGSYFAHVVDNTTEWYCLSEGPVFEPVKESDGFYIEFSINPVKPDWGHYPGLYFVSSSTNFPVGGDLYSLSFTINWSDNVIKKFTLRTESGTEFLSPTIPVINEWYDVVISKDQVSGSMSIRIFRQDGSVFVDSSNLEIDVKEFDRVYIGEIQRGPIKYGQSAQIRVGNILVR
ncbi:InlB B-repeat-containing protein [Desulfatitalea alkaliphila]|uniref:Chitobiase/beta-hexosaminidase C-terminal domain-containing protein n=1 Tax=Desulfatitalea alkaliphila TaxID=2929485 RepID=A0AA41QZW4_9BACT|nr:FN3 associated domain-containing protein [Desulfatitalea alkaliphila]MCJ8500222.1 chitobiase/beta-hexosaminidase C-terminal domain-containing protein [Desulfatitalea alkaliphila]